MKVSLPKSDSSRKMEPPLPLVSEETIEEDETKLAKWKLRTDPANAASPVYDFKMRKLSGGETLRQGIRFMNDIIKVCNGLDLTTAVNQMTIYRQMLSGEPLTQFNFGAAEQVEALTQHARNVAYNNVLNGANGVVQGNEAAAQAAADLIPVQPVDRTVLQAGLQALIRYMAPHKALAKQKRWMRRFCRKPADMSIRVFANHITRINNEEMNNLPPFAADQYLRQDEIIDIVLNGVPRSWTREMDKLDFDPIEKTLVEVIQFCERMEASEDFEPARNGNKTNDNKKSKSGSSHKSSGGSVPRKENQFCLLHGNNPTHATDKCHVLKKQAENLRNRSDDRKPTASKNKTWRRDADKATSSSKKELATFVRKQARKELYAFAKKRKVEETADDDEKSTASLNNVEMSDGEIDLSQFDYDKLGDLSISDDDDGSTDGKSVSC